MAPIATSSLGDAGANGAAANPGVAQKLASAATTVKAAATTAVAAVAADTPAAASSKETMDLEHTHGAHK